MREPKKKIAAKRKPSSLSLISTNELCKDLVRMAAFALPDNPRAQKMIYKAVLQLQLLDKAAIEAGILPPNANQQPVD